MTFYDKFMGACAGIGKTPSAVMSEIGVEESAVFDCKDGGDPDGSLLEKVGEYFHIHQSFASDDPFVTWHECPVCDWRFNSRKAIEVRKHERRHTAYMNAVKKYGFCFSYGYAFEVKLESWDRVNDETLSHEERIQAAIDDLKNFFSVSVLYSDFDLRHVDFPTYVAMRLYQKKWKEDLPNFIYRDLVAQYGTKPGIPGDSKFYRIKRK